MIWGCFCFAFGGEPRKHHPGVEKVEGEAASRGCVSEQGARYGEQKLCPAGTSEMPTQNRPPRCPTGGVRSRGYPPSSSGLPFPEGWCGRPRSRTAGLPRELRPGEAVRCVWGAAHAHAQKPPACVGRCVLRASGRTPHGIRCAHKFTFPCFIAECDSCFWETRL